MYRTRSITRCSLSSSTSSSTVAPAGLIGTSLDAWYIRRCVELALQAAGQTRPNPVVGCVIISSDGRVIGEGHHARAGQLHAEALALADARSRGENTKGATIFVSLEPCSHYGRTPPCADALIKAEVARVVVGMWDPFPKVSGRGIRRMRDAGIQVDVGIEGELCERVNEGFVSRVTTGIPFGTLKYAMSLDGKIATDTLSSKWVTGEEARKRVHAMRAISDAIVLGGATLRADNPRLSVRDGRCAEGKIYPWRVVLSRTLDLPLDSSFWDVAQDDEYAGSALVIVDAKHGKPQMVNELRARGVEVEQVSGLTPKDAAKLLAEKECMNVFWECGGSLAREVVADGCVHKVCAFIAPKLVGGSSAPTPIDGSSLAGSMYESVQLAKTEVESFDNGDLLVTGYVTN